MCLNGDAKLALTDGGKTYNLGSREGVLGFAIDFIKKVAPEIGIVIQALESVTGANILREEKPDPSMLTVRDAVGALILLKVISNLGHNAGITAQCMRLSIVFASLPQMASFSTPTERLENGRFSSVQLADAIPKPN